MPRVCRLMVWTAFFILVFSSFAGAFWGGNQQTNKSSAKPTALIVKYSPAVQFYHENDKGGAVVTNISKLNKLNEKYIIISQQRVQNQSISYAVDNPLKDVYLLYPESEFDIEEIAREYSNLNCVEYAHPNYVMELYEVPNDSLFEYQWELNNTGQEYYHVLRNLGDNNDSLTMTSGTADADIDALEVIESPPDNTNSVVVGIIDTGVDWEHPDLISHMWHNSNEIPDNGIDDDHNGFVDDVNGWNFYSLESTGWNNNPYDEHGHGTHCAGIVTALTNNGFGVAGITPDAVIMPIEFDLTVLNAVQAVIYAADNGADVVNMSWGGPWPSPLLEQALDYARVRGVILVAAAGNDGDDRTNYPTGYPSTISVTASNSEDQITSFSNYNNTNNICAPGQSILSLRAAGTDMYDEAQNEPDVHIIEENYYLASGTSMAAPHIVAVAAYMRAISPGLSPDTAQRIMELTADDFIDPYGTGANLPGWDKYSGYGRVNLPGALAITPDTRAQISSPQTFSIVSGLIEIFGSADGLDFSEYVLEYGVGSAPSEWIEITNSLVPVTDALLGSLSSVGLQGRYSIRLRVNESNMAQTDIYITENPVTVIQTPTDGQLVGGEINILGTALCEDFDYFEVEYGISTSPGSWEQINLKTTPIVDDELAIWSTISLDTGLYTLRVSVYSTTGLEASDSVSVEIGSVFVPPDGWSIPIDESLASIANYADVNQDGVNEILMGTELGMKIITTDGTIMTADIPIFPPDNYRIPPAVGRLDSDEFDDIVAVGGSGTLYGFPSQGTPFQISLEEPPDDFVWFIPGDESRLPKVYLKDVNGDGIDEIHYYPGQQSGSRSGYHFIFNADGTEWGCGFPPANSYKKCFPADLDGDGIDEIYCNGTDLAQFDTCGQWIRSVVVEWEGIPIYDYQFDISAVDIDADGKTELIVHGFFKSSSTDVYNYQLFAYNEDLVLKDGWPHDLGISGRLLASGHPVFGDLDNDGTLEYVMAHNDVPFGFLHAWHIDGVPVLGESSNGGIFALTSSPTCFSIPVIVDCNSDGFANIAVTSGAGLIQIPMIERILAFDINADYVEDYPLVIFSQFAEAYMHMPVYGDINQDGFLDVVYPSDHDKIVFTNFPQYSYNSSRSFCPMWRYNRRLNATQLFSPNDFICGDADNNAMVNILDITYLISYLYKDGPPPIQMEATDVNSSGSVNILDITYMIAYLYKGGPAPDCL